MYRHGFRNTCVIVERCFKVQNVVLVGLLVNALNRHLMIKVFKELRVALLIMINRSLP